MAAEAGEAAPAGVGLLFRRPWLWELVRHRRRLDLVEVLLEEAMLPGAMQDLACLGEAVPLVAHGTGLSLGSADGLDPVRLERLAECAERLRPAWFSEHLSFTRAGGIEIGHLTPLPRTQEAVDVMARNVDRLRGWVPGLPILLENVAWSFPPPGEMEEPEFIAAVLEATGCGLLLDLENLHANALNSGVDPLDLLRRFPVERTVEVHLAGGVMDGEFYADTHTRAVPEATWGLLEWVACRAPIRAVVIERDDCLPAFERMLEETERARSIIGRSAGRVAAAAGR